jgi:hypothetical protein
MNPLALLFFVFCAALLVAVPKRWAPVPLLAGCTYMTLGQGIEIGSISLPVYRMMLLVGVLRVVMRGEGIMGSFNKVDKAMMFWGAWMIFASFFHDPLRAGPVYAAGQVFNLTLIYFLIRIWCSDLEDVCGVIIVVALLLVPIAIEMFFEKTTGKNLFSFLGGVPENAIIREGKFRAQGPFRHPILAGTVGATCIPLFVGILQKNKMVGMIGIGAGIVMVMASASSGPVMSLMSGVGALLLFRYKNLLSTFRKFSVVLYLLLMVVMAKPPYYLIARIDISGGSTGWHRAFLIENTFKYFSEWWLFGTDFTRHWMPNQGFANDPHHTDITNYYIGFGVAGGLLSMLLIIWMLWLCFKWVGQLSDLFEEHGSANEFLIWCFGASLFAHASTSISVAYFDQSMLFFWLTVAVISSAYSINMANGGAPAHSREQDEISDEPSSYDLPDHGEWRGRLRDQMKRNCDGGTPVSDPTLS